MGSLTAGWQTMPRSSKAALKRSSSMTNDEVNKFWKAKHNSIKEHLAEAQMAAGYNKPSKVEMNDETYCIQETKIILPTAPTLLGPQGANEGKKADWWTKSRFAYLNEPPPVNDSKKRYTAQYDVAIRGLNVGAVATKIWQNTKSTSFYY